MVIDDRFGHCVGYAEALQRCPELAFRVVVWSVGGKMPLLGLPSTVIHELSLAKMIALLVSLIYTSRSPPALGSPEQKGDFWLALYCHAALEGLVRKKPHLSRQDKIPAK